MATQDDGDAVAARRRAGWRGLVMVLLALGVVAIVAGLAARMTPAWWQPNMAVGEQELEIARALEQGVASELTRVRGSGAQPWRVSVRVEELNAWLNARLPQWLEHDRSLPWPEGVSLPQVRVDADGIHAAAQWGGWTLSTRWQIEPASPPQAREASDPAAAEGAPRAARLTPVGTVLGRLPMPLAGSVGGWFLPELAAPVPLELTLGDGRMVRITGAAFSEGQVILDCVTVHRARDGAAPSR